MNLLSLVEKLGQDEAAVIPAVDAKRCLHYVDRLNPCTACADLCPAGAITLAEPDKMPNLDPEACQHCLACLPACPTGVYSAEDAVPDLVRCAGRLHYSVLEVACIHHPDIERGPGEAAVRVQGCLAGVGSGAYLALAARGVPSVVVRTDVCGQCPWGTLEANVSVQVARAEAILNLWDNPMVITVAGDKEATWQERPIYRAESPPFTRRALAQMAREEEGERIISGKNPFHERLRSVHGVQALPPLEEGVLERALPAEAGFAMVYVGDACSACGTCERACPTGAIEVDVTDDWFRLTFAPQACLACDMCARLCPEEAITIEHAPMVTSIFGEAKLFLLYEGEARRCLRCNAPFAPRKAGDQYCEICDFRRQNRFGTKPPPRSVGVGRAQRRKDSS